jgi:hypothetical protein
MLGRRLLTIVASGLLLTLGACATASMPSQMVAMPGAVGQAKPGDVGYQQFSVANVSGGTETNPLLWSEISNQSFRQALESSLQGFNYLAPNGSPGQYGVTAAIVDLQQPYAGLDMSVTMKVRYSVQPLVGGTPIFDETISTTGTATMGQAFLGVQRLQMANEAAAKLNIEAFVRRLRETTVK